MKTVLILDDDDAVRRSLVDYFEDLEWQVLPAASAEEAMEILKEQKPDGAVVDIRLPGMNGTEFIRLANRMYPGMAYIIVTGSPEYSPPEDVERVLHSSKYVFNKPVIQLNLLVDALLEQIDACQDSI